MAVPAADSPLHIDTYRDMKTADAVEQHQTPSAEEIVDIFSKAGLNTSPDQMDNRLYTVRGQLAQLVNGARALLSRFGPEYRRDSDERWYSMATVNALIKARDDEIAELRAQISNSPQLHIRCETREPGLIGSATLDVARVEKNDDGSYTAVTHYWPPSLLNHPPSAGDQRTGPGMKLTKMTKWVPTTNLMMLRRMGKLQEELNELGGVASRCIIQGIDEVDPGTGKVNRERLWHEVADVYAQLDETVARLGLNRADIEARRAVKRGYMQEWEAMFESPDPTSASATGERRP